MIVVTVRIMTVVCMRIVAVVCMRVVTMIVVTVAFVVVLTRRGSAWFTEEREVGGTGHVRGGQERAHKTDDHED